ncbi:CaiB/BaiF CoA transferase family protein [Pararoseomonas indoligenes]|uniref:CoA transferase n=1 Tax=Roseomonas indoligenes TaxID=2820811 RepID=A0A940S6D8_9PROT|nr:CoA transferase [Pararoseomonas indoligenes]MBP0495416.1 CoA transferase [Pararoseomonas indoligenes]
MTEVAAEGPLRGIRVLDLSRLVCGNMLTMLLGDFGADVAKVEEPGPGDPLRAWIADGIAAHWKVYGRNKRSIALDLRSADGRAVLERLIARTDVLVEGFRPGTLERWGLAPALLLERHPDLVVVRISGFGQTGDYRMRPGYGSLIEGFSGFASRNGFPDRPPLLPSFPLADMVAGMMGAFATVSAVRAREAGGRGQVVDLSLLEPMVAMFGADAVLHGFKGTVRGRLGSQGASAAPRNTFLAGDGNWLTISAPMQSMTEKLFDAMGRPEMKTDPRFATNTARLTNVEALEAEITAWLSTRSAAEAWATLDAAGVTAAPILDAAGLAADPHVLSRGVFRAVEDAELGQVTVPDVVPRFSATPGAVRRPAPAVGQDSRAILAEAGHDDGTIDALIAAKVVAEN